MTIQIKELELCKDQVSWTADQALVAEIETQALKFLKQQKVKVAGFRPGKAPNQVLKLKLRPQIEGWMKQELQSEAVDSYRFKSKAKTIGYPMFRLSELHGSEYWCEFEVLRKPQVTLQQYKGFEIPKPHQSKNAQEMAEHMLQDLRVQHGELVAFEEQDTVCVGDKVTLDRHCRINGEPVPEFTVQGELYLVSDSEFDLYLVGMMVREAKEFSTTFPDSEGNQITANWTITIHAGLKIIPAALDDSLAQKAGQESYDQLRQTMEAQAAHQAKAIESQLISQQLIKRILANHEIELPTWLVHMEAQHLLAQAGKKWEKLPQEQKNQAAEQAQQNVKWSLILDSIREAEPETVFTHNELLESVRQRLAASGKDPQQILAQAEKDGSLLGYLESLRNDVTIQWLLKQSTIVEND